MATEELKTHETPKKRRRELVPVAVTRIRTGPAWGDAIEAGEEVPRAMLAGLTEKKKDKKGKYPAIYDYEMGSYVAAGEAAAG